MRAKYVHQVLKLSVQIPHDRERRASGDGELDHVWHLAESRGLAAHELLGHRAPDKRRTRIGKGHGMLGPRACVLTPALHSRPHWKTRSIRAPFDSNGAWRSRHDTAAAECGDKLEDSGLVDRRREGGGAANATGHHIRQILPRIHHPHGCWRFDLAQTLLL